LVATNRADDAALDATGSPRGGSRLLLAPEAKSKEREPPPRKAVASSKVDCSTFSGERKTPPDKPGASAGQAGGIQQQFSHILGSAGSTPGVHDLSAQIDPALSRAVL